MSVSITDWRADFAVFNRAGDLVVIAEAKTKVDGGPQWATGWFRNYLADRRGSAPAFVLLATPERVFLWKQPSAASSPEPTAIADARGLFSAYLQRSNLAPTDLSGSTFELVVGAWLNDFSQGLWQPSSTDETRALVETGLFEAIENGRVVTADVAA
jgi:hypothetical protein